MNETLEDVISKIKSVNITVAADMDKVENKSAARRARKATLELEKLYKQYRKLSVK